MTAAPTQPTVLRSVEATRRALARLLEDDPSLVLLGEAVGRHGGVTGASRTLMERFGPDRVIDTPISAASALGLGVGMALAGRRAVVELSGADQLQAALDLLLNDVLPAVRAGWPVPLVVRLPDLAGTVNGGHPGLEPLLAAAGDLQVACASGPGSAASLLLAAHASLRPTVLVEPLALAEQAGPVDFAPAPVGRAHRLRAGRDVVLLTWGSGCEAALDGAERAAREGHEAEVLDLRWLAPLDREAIGEAVRRTGRVVLVPGGAVLPEALLAALDAAFLYLESPPSTAPADPAAVARAIHSSVTW